MRACPDCQEEIMQHKHGRASRCAPCGATAKEARLHAFRETPKGKYGDQKQAAKQRGIKWNFTLESWIRWWGRDLPNRGTGRNELCMGRKGDTGEYSPQNTFKLTNYENQNLRIS